MINFKEKINMKKFFILLCAVLCLFSAFPVYAAEGEVLSDPYGLLNEISMLPYGTALFPPESVDSLNNFWISLEDYVEVTGGAECNYKFVIYSPKNGTFSYIDRLPYEVEIYNGETIRVYEADDIEAESARKTKLLSCYDISALAEIVANSDFVESQDIFYMHYDPDAYLLLYDRSNTLVAYIKQSEMYAYRDAYDPNIAYSDEELQVKSIIDVSLVEKTGSNSATFRLTYAFPPVHDVVDTYEVGPMALDIYDGVDRTDGPLEAHSWREVIEYGAKQRGFVFGTLLDTLPPSSGTFDFTMNNLENREYRCWIYTDKGTVVYYTFRVDWVN